MQQQFKNNQSIWAPTNKPRWLQLAKATRTDYPSAWRQISERLGHMHMAKITTFVVARYIHIERASAPRRADIEKSLLSRLFGHAIKLGACTINGTIGVKPRGSEARTMAVDAQVLTKYLANSAATSPS